VPQESILGPLLFNIYINDLLWSYNITSLCNFADDITIYNISYNINQVKHYLENGVDYILEWFRSNSLVENPDKFQLIYFGPKLQEFKKELSLEIGDIMLKNQNNVKLLGVTIDSKLKFDKHIDTLCKSANQKLCALIRIRKYLSIEQVKTLAYSYIFSNFQYCNLVWMFCNKTENSKINEIQKRTLRCIFKRPTAELDELLREFNLKSIHTRNLQSLLLFIYRFIKGLCPDISKDLFEYKHEVNYSLRSNNCLALPKCNTVTMDLTQFLLKEFYFGNHYQILSKV